MMASPVQAINELLEKAVALGYANEKVADSHEDRIARMEALCYHGNGDSFVTKIRLLAQEIARVEERREDALRERELFLQGQIDFLRTQLAEQRAIQAEHTKGKWAMLTAIIAAMIGAAVALLKKP